MNKFLWIVFGILTLNLAHAASFDCSKANSKVERSICQNQELSEVDSKLEKIFKSVRNNYDEIRQKSLIQGQRKWLKLRTVACISKEHPNDGNDFQSCLLSLYTERLQELLEEQTMQTEDRKVGIRSTANFEKIIDKPLLETSSQGMWPDGVYSESEEIKPATCREFFTLDAGIWKYGGDNIGQNAYLYSLNSCAFEIFSARNFASENNNTNDIDFGDITQYSTEIACIAGCNDDNDEFVNTFSEEANQNKILIIQNMYGVIADNTLAIGKNKFQINGMHYNYVLSPIGDYTNRGRKEVLMSIGYYSVTGSMQGGMVIVVYYDPEANAIRPETIDPKSRLRLFTVEN